MKKLLKQFLQHAESTDFKCSVTKTQAGKEVVIIYREPYTTAIAVIENGGKLSKIGRAEFAFKDDNKTFYLRMIKIEEEFRNQGIGSAMMQNLVEYAQLKHCEKIELVAAKRLREFYSHMGFDCTCKSNTSFAVMDLSLAKNNTQSL